MIAMGSLRKREIKEQLVEICHLRKGFEALTIDHKKVLLKTAQGLLRIQRACRTMTTYKT
jgi:aromatic ring hydroxylase